ncbi:hypothetical protein WMF11_39930 [Sorangium sp. So ce295]|uniref:hypothetical protein n=1 Tax=Sorangium sp. So ce295 TaxID=3133295 RepID=UPI003F5DDDAD
MGRRSFQIIGAVGILAAMFSALIPACVIRIGPGDGDDGGSLAGGDSSDDNAGDNGEQTDGSEFTPEEQAAIDDLENADPNEASRTLLVSEYAGYAVAGFIESSGVDPATADQATIDQLIEQYAPVAWQMAQEWVDTLDPSAIPLDRYQRRHHGNGMRGWKLNDGQEQAEQRNASRCAPRSAGRPLWHGRVRGGHHSASGTAGNGEGAANTITSGVIAGPRRLSSDHRRRKATTGKRG